MATIVTKNSSTASAVPTTSDLVQGELAVNVTDKRIFTENASTQIVELGTNPSTVTTATATVTGTLTANGTFASSNAVITGGTVNSTPIGATTASTVRGTTVTATTGFVGGLTGNVTGNLTGNVTGNVTGNLTGNVTGNVTASSGTTTLNDLVVNGTADFTNTKLTNITTPTADSDAANKGYVDATVAAVIDSAPAALDTLNELAAALGDDANFSATVTTALATKLPLAGGTMTGAIAMGTSKITGLGDPTASQDAATKTYVDTADALKLNLTGGTMSGAIAMGTNKVTGVGDPTNAQDAATKAYTDSILGSATSAADSAAAAATSASNAATSASNASSSATASASSASASASSAAAAASTYDDFDDRYLGDKASDPTLDNDGNALLTGALYFNTTTDVMRVYNGSAWQDVAISTNSPTFTGTVTADGLVVNADALINDVTVGRGAGNVSTNTAVGNGALESNTTGQLNASYGFNTLTSNTTGLYNVAVGYIALSSNISGRDNTAIGSATLAFNTSSNNTAVGSFALYSNTTAAGNTATGYLALRSNTIGSQNTAYGSEALPDNTTGGQNTSIGRASLYTNIVGSNNVAIGETALKLSKGSNNTAIGTGAGEFLTTGANNTVIGYAANASSATVSNETTIGNTSVTSTRIFGDISFYEDTGTTPKFFWDASAEALRVGSTAAIFTNSVISGVSALGPTLGAKQTVATQVAGGFWNSDTGTVNLVDFYAGSGGSKVGSIQGFSTGISLLGVGGNSGLTISGTSGNVGIGAIPNWVLQTGNLRGTSTAPSFTGTADGFAVDVYNEPNPYERHISLAAVGAGTAVADMSFYVDNGSAAIKAMTLDSSGNVGIGTTSPAYNLHVEDTSASVAVISGTSGNSTILLGDTADNNKGRIIYTQSIDTMKLITNGTEAMRIDSSGNVGIGTTSPLLSLDVRGNVGFLATDNASTRTLYLGPADFASSAKYLAIQWGHANSQATYYTQGAYPHVFFTNNTERMRIDGSGNVGIGTTTVGQFGGVDVGLTVDGGGAYSGIAVTDGATTGSLTQGYSTTYLYNQANGNMLFGTNNTEKMRITASGNVGIGNDAPASMAGGTANTAIVTIGGGDGSLVTGDRAGSLSFRSEDASYKNTFADGIASEIVSITESSVGSSYGLAFYTGTITGSDRGERLRISAAGNVGIGNTAPQYQLDLNTTGSNTLFGAGISASGSPLNLNLSSWGQSGGRSGIITFTTGSTTNGTESMRIDASGNLLVGATSAMNVSTNGHYLRAYDGGYAYHDMGHPDATASGAYYNIFRYNTSVIGTVTQNGTSGVSYNTTSDYRLKENVVALTGATDRLKQLKPSRFNFIADSDITVDGFLAHEVQDVVPEAITGTKDAVDDEGNPVYQGIDQSKLVPLLVATIKELEARISTLEGN